MAPANLDEALEFFGWATPLVTPPPGAKLNQQAISDAAADALRDDWQGPLEQPPFVYDPDHGYVRNPLSPRRDP